MFKKLLEYQEVDKGLKVIEDNLRKSEDYQNYAKATRFLKSANQNNEQFEERAKALFSNMQELEKAYKLLLEEQADFDGVNEATEESTIAFLKKKSQELSKRFASLEAEISKLTEEINSFNDQYKKFLATVKKMKEVRENSAQAYKELSSSMEAEKQAIVKKLETIAKDIPNEYMQKYQEKRKDGKFPIVYKVDASKREVHCSACGTELSTLEAANLKKEKFLECENCHKLIFVEE